MTMATERIQQLQQMYLTNELKKCYEIKALVRQHDQRQPLYGKDFDAQLDTALRELFGLEELL